MSNSNFFYSSLHGDTPMPECTRLLGAVVRNVDSVQMAIEVEFDAKNEFTNPVGNIQGGMLAAMLDDVMGPALASALSADEFAPTVSMSVQFYYPGKVGKIQGFGKVERKGGQVCHLSGSLYQEDRLIAHGTSTSVIKKIAG